MAFPQSGSQEIESEPLYRVKCILCPANEGKTQAVGFDQNYDGRWHEGISGAFAIYKKLAALSQGSLRSTYIVHLLDDFLHQGPNGSHQCLVFELLGPSVDAVVADYGEFGDRLEPETIFSPTPRQIHLYRYS